MRDKAKTILYNKLKYQGLQYCIFNEVDEELTNNAIIETIIDAMVEFKQLPNRVHNCRLYTSKKHCKDYLYNKLLCKTCPHLIK